MNRERINQIIPEITTSAYVYDFDEFQHRSKQIKEIVGDKINLCYSMKANPFFAQKMAEVFTRVEVCSHGEFLICKNSNINPNMIFYSGVNKKCNEVEEAFLYGVRTFTAESKKHIEILDYVTKKYETSVNVFPRIASDSQFGMDYEDVKELIQKRNDYKFLKVKGLHYFTGTQKKKTEQIENELQYLLSVIKEINDTFDFHIDEIEYGTGLYIEYFGDDRDNFNDLIRIHSALLNLAEITNLTIEMGRFFAAPCGVYLTVIDDIKQIGDVRYIIVSGGVHQVVYDGQLKGMRKMSITHLRRENLKELAPPSCYTICGSLCTHNDVLVRDYELNNPVIGDVLVFDKVGAYSSMEGMSTFLSRDMPSVWGVQNNDISLLRRSIETNVYNCSI